MRNGEVDILHISTHVNNSHWTLLSVDIVDLTYQQDSYSCGVVVLSTLAHHLLHYEPWSTRTENEHLTHWFLRLTNGLQDNEVNP